MKVKVLVFWLGHFARLKIESISTFLIKYYTKTILIFLECFGLYLTKSKNGFPIVISNLARKGSGFFQDRKLIFFPIDFYLSPKQP